MKNISLELQKRDDFSLIKVEGNLDINTNPEAKDFINKLIEEGDIKLVLDLDHIKFIDSSGLGFLVGTWRRIKEHKGALYLICNNEKVRNLLELTGLIRIFEIIKEEKELPI